MAGLISWASGAIQSVGIQASGQGLPLTNGSAVLLATDLDNRGVSGGPAFFADVELLASASGFGAATAALQEIDFYFVPSRDGTNFPNVDTTGPVIAPSSYKGSFITAVSGNNQARLAIEGVPLMPVKYRGYIVNRTGQTLTSGWGVTIDLYEQFYT